MRRALIAVAGGVKGGRGTSEGGARTWRPAPAFDVEMVRMRKSLADGEAKQVVVDRAAGPDRK